jgi:hypothetical protein
VKRLHLVEPGSAETEATRLALPEHDQLSLIGIAESAKEGLMALAVGAGLAVLHECMEHEVTEVVGPKGGHDADRTAKRHGHTLGELTLGGRRVPISRPGDDRVDDDREAERLFSLLLRGALADVSFVGVEDGASENVELLALVELATDTRS